MARASPKARTTKPGKSASGLGARESLGFYSYTVRDVMTRKVAVVAPDASLAAAAAVMSRRAVSGLPVVDPKGRVVGVLSQKDILRLLQGTSGFRLPRSVFDLILSARSGRSAAVSERNRRTLETMKVRGTMTRPAISIAPGASLDDAVRILLEHQINRLPVVSEGRLVGIVTRHDLLTGLTPGEPVDH